MQFMWIAVGGGAGSVIRYLVGLAFSDSHFPWGTLLVNITGAFIIGFLFSWGLERLPSEITTPLAVGLLGGFTTFSTFAWEGLFLAGNGQAAQAVTYVGVSVIGGLAAALLGRALGEVLL